MATYHSIRAALTHHPLTAVASNLLESLDPDGTDAYHHDIAIRIDRTARMGGDYVASTQHQTIEIWRPASDAGKRYPDEYYVCDDAGPTGGEVQLRPDGIALVDLGDGTRLNVDTGEFIDPNERT